MCGLFGPRYGECAQNLNLDHVLEIGRLRLFGSTRSLAMYMWFISIRTTWLAGIEIEPKWSLLGKCFEVEVRIQ